MADDCSQLSKLPNLVFKFQVLSPSPQFFTLTLRPADYVLKFNIDGQVIIGIMRMTVWSVSAPTTRRTLGLWDKSFSRPIIQSLIGKIAELVI